MSDPIVVVRGAAERLVQPDEASLDWRTTVTGRDQGQVRNEVAARLARVKQELDGLTAVVRASDWVRVGPRVRWVKNRSIPDGFEGSAHVSLTLNDFAGIGQLITDLTSMDEVTVTGPTWTVRADNPVHTEARLAAIRDAQRMAVDYAAAFGVQVTGLLEVSDQDAGARDLGGAFFARAVEPVELDLTPQEQQIEASVLVRFTIGQPDQNTLNGSR